MKFFKQWIVCFVLINLAVIGQEIEAQEPPTNQLYQGLGDLRKNVDRLSVTNQTLILKNEKMKVSLNSLQINYQKLNQENLQLEDVQSKLQKNITPKNQQTDHLNKTLSDLNAQDAALTQQQKNLQDQIGVLKAQDESLRKPLDRLVQWKGEDNVSKEMSEILQQKQKQKLAMLKLIADSQDHQALLQAKFLDFKNNTLDVVSNSNFGYKKESLELQISQLQDELMHLNSIVNNSKPAWSEEQMRQLELSVNSLEQSRDELKVLLKKMQLKTQKIVQNQNKSEEQLKLEVNTEALKREAKNLRIDLEEIQQQMIGLDKRKAYLEALLQ